MRVTRLEIFGFKSFVERFVLNFDRNMIGIVGPNGCGKSNIVDALRWVLGETYAKQLRGTVFDDLIFNGSEARRPLGMAEVSITIRPQEGWQLATPELEENGEPHLRSAQEESFEESDEAEEHASERSIASAEAASADAMMNPFPAAFAEIPGLLNASEIQFTRRLYRSGESEYFINRVPCRLRDMVDIYRLIGLGARGLSIVQQGEIGELISKKPIERRELLEEAAGISGFRTRMEAAQRKLEKNSENMARLRDIISEVDKQVRMLQRQARRARDRNELKGELRTLDIELCAAKTAKISSQRERHSSLSENLESELERAKSELALAEATQTELQAQLEQFEVQISDKRRERDGYQQVLDSARARTSEMRLELAVAAERIETIKKNIKRSEEKRTQLQEEIERTSVESRSIVEKITAAAACREEAVSRLEQIQRFSESGTVEAETARQLSLDLDFGAEETEAIRAEMARLEAELSRLPELEQGLKSSQEAVRHAEQQLSAREKQAQKDRLAAGSLEAQVTALEKQIESLAEHVMKAAGSDAGEGAENEQGRIGKDARVLLAGLRVPEELQQAVSAVLGERGEYLLSPAPFALGAAFARGASRSGTRIGVIDKNLPSPSALKDLTEEERTAAPSAKRLTDLLEIESDFSGAALTFLGEFFVVDNFEEALRLNEGNRSASRGLRSLVTRSGEIFHPWGWFTTEGKGASFAITRKLAEVRERAAAATKTVELSDAAAEEAESLLQEKRSALVTAQEARESVLGLQRQMMQLADREREFARKRRESILAVERKAQEELRRLSNDLTSLEREREFGERQSEHLREEIALLAEQEKKQEEEIAALTAKRAEIEQQLRSGESGVDLNEIQASMRLLEDEVRALDQDRNPLRLKIGEQAETLAQSRRELSQFQEQFNKVALEIEKCDLEMRMIAEDFARVYVDAPTINQAALDTAVLRAEGDLDKLIAELQDEAGKIRRRIEREGEVDPQTIELYEQEDARLQGMKSQLADLEEATEILERTIRQLKEVSRTRFLETFEAVSTKFSELVPRLFGGGSGQMSLVNPDDPLESGVEIFVRPPGKKISNMELLSGGEKALVAVSVLISMFLHRPSPICVLDEVDAPLDEANLERYLGLVSEISGNTQFLIITHNKRTMAQVQRLVGITMQEKGVSTALSVSLDESEEQIDRWIANA